VSSIGNLATIVLAAGGATRFGSAKMLAQVDETPILTRVLDSASGFGSVEIAVLGASAVQIEPLVLRSGWLPVLAAEWAAGPGASLRAGLAAAPDADAALIVLGDLAWLRREAIQRVIDAATAAPASDQAVRAFEGSAPGHPLLLRGGLLDQVRASPDEGARKLVAAAGVIRVDCSGLGVCRDVDTVDDLL
jgi:CTP:molybdopterin cytidylyltransferase MocA